MQLEREIIARSKYHELLQKWGQYTKTWMNLAVWLNQLEAHTISDVQKDIWQFCEHVRSVLTLKKSIIDDDEATYLNK